MRVFIIGGGGGGSWLLPSMCMLVGRKHLIIVDRDKLTQKNLNRQLFTEEDVGKNKAVALAERYHCEALPIWYTLGCIDLTRDDWLISCADNHPCRLAILRSVDQFKCRAIIAANEKTSSEAYFYRRDWRDTPLDPRCYYPDIETDDTDDPSRPETCTGEAQVATPQLVSANVMAISLAQWLYVFWGMKRPGMGLNVDESNFPYHYRANMTMLETFRIKDANKSFELVGEPGTEPEPTPDGASAAGAVYA